MLWLEITLTLSTFGLTWMLLAARRHGWALPIRHIAAGSWFLIASVVSLITFLLTY